jgi:S1-C subfamily serine protease
LNGSVHLLHRSVPTTLHLQATIPAEHASSAILGNERMGTATLLRETGIALTAHYIVAGATSIEATTVEGSTHQAKVLGIDFESGIAALGVDVPQAPGVRLRGSEDLVLGEDVFLVASVGEGRRVNSGNVSSIAPFEAFWEYSLERAITVTADNPGLPGGPLLDRFGRMLGIVALSLAEVGKPTLVIPETAARPVIAEIEKSGTYRNANPRAWIGVTCYPLRDHVVVAGVLPGSPAEHAGLQPGDLIVAVDGEATTDRRALYSRIWRHRRGAGLRLRILRDDHASEVEVVASSIEEYFS